MTSAKRCYNGSGDSAHVQPPETLPSPRKCPHQAPMLDPTVKRSSGTATTEMKKPKREMETNLNWLNWLKSLNDAAFARSEVALFHAFLHEESMIFKLFNDSVHSVRFLHQLIMDRALGPLTVRSCPRADLRLGARDLPNPGVFFIMASNMFPEMI